MIARMIRANIPGWLAGALEKMAHESHQTLFALYPDHWVGMDEAGVQTVHGPHCRPHGEPPCTPNDCCLGDLS